MTLAYDSDKDEDDARFGGVIDPRAYYTIYADRNETRYDAASVRKLSLRPERPHFYALLDRKSGAQGKSVSVRVALGGSRFSKKQNITSSRMLYTLHAEITSRSVTLLRLKNHSV